MKRKIWIYQLPIITFFATGYYIAALGVQGQLSNSFARDKLYPALSWFSNLLTDLKFSVRGPVTPKNKIVVIEIDNTSIDEYGRWPWHRDVTARLVAKTFSAGAKVVGLDMVFSEADLRVPEGLASILEARQLADLMIPFETDPTLREVIQKYSDRLVLGWAANASCQPLYETTDTCPVTHPDAIREFPEDFQKYSFSFFNFENQFSPENTPIVSFLSPLINQSYFHEVAGHAGYFSAFLDSDSHIRRTSLAVLANAKPYPMLALEMARIGLNEELQLTLDSSQRVKSLGFKKSGQDLSVTPLASMQINFRGPNKVFTRVSAADILGKVSGQDSEVPLSETVQGLLKDAYVLIGVSALGVFDMRSFPFEENAPGVYGHANILDNVLSNDPLIPESRMVAAVWVILFMILGVAAFAIAVESLDAIPALFLFGITFIGIVLIDFKILFGHNYNWNTVFIYLEISTVFFLTLAAKYVLEEKNKKFIRSAFSKYVPSTVVDAILKDPSKLTLGGEKRELTIMFSDIRGFTTFSEKMDAKALASFLNDYLGIMTNLVFLNLGTLDKYIGDAVMAFWGAPLDQPDHASNACQAAVQMMQALQSHQERFKKQYDIEVNIGIGINSGVVNVGNMGSENNFEYTVIGDHVNLASRLEGLTKKYGVAIVTTRFTYDSIAKSGKPTIPYRILDFVKVKGKKQAVELLQILEKSYSSSGLKLFEEGRQLYLKQKWDEAILKLREANALLAQPDKMDGPCEVFIERCEFFRKEAPAADWDGSWEMESK